MHRDIQDVSCGRQKRTLFNSGYSYAWLEMKMLAQELCGQFQAILIRIFDEYPLSPLRVISFKPHSVDCVLTGEYK